MKGKVQVWVGGGTRFSLKCSGQCYMVLCMSFYLVSLTELCSFWNARFILEQGVAGFPQFGKKMPQKIYVAGSNGAQKNRTKDKYYFFKIKYSKTSLTTTLI